MRQAPGRSSEQAVAGGDSLYKYALPFRSDRLLYRLLTSPAGRRVGELCNVPQNKTIFKAGERPSRVWIVSGTARLFFPSGRFARSTSRLTPPGELIGLSETLAQTPYNATLKAISRCECLIITRDELIAMLEQDKLLRESLLEELAALLNKAIDTLRDSRVTRVTYGGTHRAL